MTTSKKRSRLAWIVGAILLFIAVAAVVLPPIQQRRAADPAYWEGAIAAFEAADRERPPPRDAILFTGSSSIRLWPDLAGDMAPLPVLQRGFGGSHLDHVVHYFDRLVAVYAPRAVVVYAGDNDLASGSGKTAEDVAADFDELAERLHATRPDAHLYFIAIKPSRLRWGRWPEMQRANALIEERCAADPRRHYLDIATPMLDANGEPREALLRFDGLHLTDEGYAVWTRVIRPPLLAFWRDAAGVGPVSGP